MAPISCKKGLSKRELYRKFFRIIHPNKVRKVSKNVSGRSKSDLLIFSKKISKTTKSCSNTLKNNFKIDLLKSDTILLNISKIKTI